MKKSWSQDEIIEHFTLLTDERHFLGIKEPHNQFGKAVLLKCFQYEGRFPEAVDEIAEEIMVYIAQQLEMPDTLREAYDWTGRRSSEHRQDIRERLGFRSTTLADQEALRAWIMNELLKKEYRPRTLEDQAYDRLRELHLEPPSARQMRRLVRSALHRYEQAIFVQTAERLSPEVRQRLQDLMGHTEEVDDEASLEGEATLGAGLNELKIGAGAPNVKNVKQVCQRLKQLQALELPSDLFTGVPLDFLRQCRQQVAVESPSHLQRRLKEPTGEAQTVSMLAAFCWVRQQEITDDVVDLLLRILKDIRVRAKSKEEHRLLHDFIRVNGKQQLLFRLAQAMFDHPDGIIRDVLYPVVGEDRLKALVEEAKHSGVYQHGVQTHITASYTHHYRQILPVLLDVLRFRSNNDQYHPLIEALKTVEQYMRRKDAFYPQHAAIPLEDVIQKQWQSWIYQSDKSGLRRIRRARYEVCVLQAIGDQLRSKEIWIERADRYRNPADDVPADFRERRPIYYEALNLPLSSKTFVTQLKTQMTQALQDLNDSLPSNEAVKILPKAGGWIKVRPYEKQDDPGLLCINRQKGRFWRAERHTTWLR